MTKLHSFIFLLCLATPAFCAAQTGNPRIKEVDAFVIAYEVVNQDGIVLYPFCFTILSANDPKAAKDISKGKILIWKDYWSIVACLQSEHLVFRNSSAADKDTAVLREVDRYYAGIPDLTKTYLDSNASIVNYKSRNSNCYFFKCRMGIMECKSLQYSDRKHILIDTSCFVIARMKSFYAMKEYEVKRIKKKAKSFYRSKYGKGYMTGRRREGRM